MSALTQPRLTPQEYLDWERLQETRHEYVNGEIHAMTGASRKHNLVCLSFASVLYTRMRGKPYEVYGSTMRVKVDATGMYTYPDIVVAGGQPQFEDQCVDTLLNPLLIVEVLSDLTESYDRGAKFLHYRKLPSLREYLLVAQNECRVEHYLRQDENRWLLGEYSSPDDTVALVSLDCTVPLGELYERALTELPELKP